MAKSIIKKPARRKASSRSRSIKAATARGPIDNFWYAPVGLANTSGIDITPDVSLTLSTVFCAVNLLSNTMKTVPLFVYRRLADGGREVAKNHPLQKLLHVAPSPDQSAGRFKWYMQACALLWGNGYAEIQRNGRGEPVALWPIHPARVTPRYDSFTDRLYFEVRGTTGVTDLVPSADMFHYYGFTNDNLCGVSVVTVARESMGLALATQQFGAAYFGNGAKPGGILEHPGKLSESASKRLRSSWSDVHQGSANANKVAILEEGMKFQSIGIPPEDSQFLQTREFQVDEIARWFNVPPHKLKAMRQAKYNVVEEQNIEFVGDTMLPWFTDFEEQASLKLFSNQGRGDYFAEFKVDGLLRGNSAARSAYYREMLNIGVMTINEIRQLENLNPIGEDGDKHFLQMNMTTVEKIGEDKPEPVAPSLTFGGDAEVVDVPDEEGTQDAEPVQDDEPEARLHNPADAMVYVFTDTLLRLRRKEAKVMGILHGRPTAEAAEKFNKFWSELFVEATGRMEPAVLAAAELMEPAPLTFKDTILVWLDMDMRKTMDGWKYHAEKALAGNVLDVYAAALVDVDMSSDAAGMIRRLGNVIYLKTKGCCDVRPSEA